VDRAADFASALVKFGGQEFNVRQGRVNGGHVKWTLIALGVFCWLVTVRLIMAAVTATHQVQALVFWALVVAGAYGGLSLFRRAKRPEYRQIPPQQSTRDWDSYIAPKPAVFKASSSRQNPANSSTSRAVDPPPPAPSAPPRPAVGDDPHPLLLDPSISQANERPRSGGQKGLVVRADITAAIEAAPADVQAALGTSGLSALKFLDEHLPQAEQVRHIVSAGVDYSGALENCALVVTDLRLLFVNPLPQVIAWNLTQIADVNAFMGFRLKTYGGGEMTLGINGGWASTFVKRLQVAMAVATLRATA
jgi:hypothetical protein